MKHAVQLAVEEAAARRKTAGSGVGGVLFALIALLFLVMAVVQNPELPGGEQAAGTLDMIAANPGAAMMTPYLDLAYSVVVALAFFFAARRLEGRGAGAAAVGAAIAVAGNMAHSAVAFLEYIVVTMAGLPEQREAMIALWTKWESGPFLIPFLLLIVSYLVGIIVFAVGLYRAGKLPLWGIIAVIAIAIAKDVAKMPDALSDVTGAAVFALLAWGALRSGTVAERAA
ncbi:hypothetical protein [Paenibacillus sp.]|uniref:hypothetical protein n=1 Tax=Paenibacillus sp. TaxID=58172 RepID=UPI002D5126F1|nr:hypothetical protein [Paenibacillus sp.]HZG86084.1 hypothetical protein [Paenibacillus sp.]